DAAHVIRIAQLVAAVAEHAGCPQDMEWAIADGAVSVLQARPVTGLAATVQIPIEEEVPGGFWVLAPNVDTPWVPMQRSVFLPVFDVVAGNVFRYTTRMRVSAGMIRGWTYLTVRADDPAEQVRKLEEIAVAVARGEPADVVRQWNTEWKPRFAGEIRQLRDTPVQNLDDA